MKEQSSSRPIIGDILKYQRQGKNSKTWSSKMKSFLERDLQGLYRSKFSSKEVVQHIKRLDLTEVIIIAKKNWKWWKYKDYSPISCSISWIQISHDI